MKNIIHQAASVYQTVKFLRILPSYIGGIFLALTIASRLTTKTSVLTQENFVAWILVPYLLYILIGTITTALNCIGDYWDIDLNSKDPSGDTFASHILTGVCLMISTCILVWPLFTWGKLIIIAITLLLSYGVFCGGFSFVMAVNEDDDE